MRFLRKKTGEKGVTLIELAVVMAIVGIMALFMAPAIGEWLDNFRIRQAAREISSDLQFARMKAISTGQYCTVAFNANGYVIFPDYDKDLKLDAGNETNDILKVSLLEPNISFDTAQGGGTGIDCPVVNGQPAIAFDRSGLPRDNAGRLGNSASIYIQNTKNKKRQQITISPSGRISINEY